MKFTRGRQYVRIDPAIRFATKVDQRGPDDCWPWTGNMNPAGRGVFYWSDEERTITAPRAALRVAGVNVPRDKLVCHHCDNKSCVNPRHLYVGDYSSNITDAWDRGQRSKNSNIRGSRHGMAKLDEDGVRRIRALAAEGVRQNQIAAELGIGTTTVNNVILRRTWKHV